MGELFRADEDGLDILCQQYIWPFSRMELGSMNGCLERRASIIPSFHVFRNPRVLQGCQGDPFNAASTADLERTFLVKRWIRPIYPVKQEINSVKTIRNVALGSNSWGHLSTAETEAGRGPGQPHHFFLTVASLCIGCSKCPPTTNKLIYFTRRF